MTPELLRGHLLSCFDTSIDTTARPVQPRSVKDRTTGANLRPVLCSCAVISGSQCVARERGAVQRGQPHDPGQADVLPCHGGPHRLEGVRAVLSP